MQNHDKSIDQRDNPDLTHPAAEEWMEYLYGETTSKRRRELSAHAKTCSQCRTRIADWRRTKASLNEDVIHATGFGTIQSAGILKWAAAIAILACGLYGTAKGTVNSRQISELRGSVERSVRASLEPEIKTRLALAEAGAMERMRSEMAQMREKTLASAQADNQQLLESLTKITARARSEDREFLMNTLQQIEDRRSNELAALRKELETVAVLTEASLKKAQQQIIQLASYSDGSETSAKQ